MRFSIIFSIFLQTLVLLQVDAIQNSTFTSINVIPGNLCPGAQQAAINGDITISACYDGGVMMKQGMYISQALSKNECPSPYRVLPSSVYQSTGFFVACRGNGIYFVNINTVVEKIMIVPISKCLIVNDMIGTGYFNTQDFLYIACADEGVLMWSWENGVKQKIETIIPISNCPGPKSLAMASDNGMVVYLLAVCRDKVVSSYYDPNSSSNPSQKRVLMDFMNPIYPSISGCPNPELVFITDGWVYSSYNTQINTFIYCGGSVIYKRDLDNTPAKLAKFVGQTLPTNCGRIVKAYSYSSLFLDKNYNPKGSVNYLAGEKCIISFENIDENFSMLSTSFGLSSIYKWGTDLYYTDSTGLNKISDIIPHDCMNGCQANKCAGQIYCDISNYRNQCQNICTLPITETSDNKLPLIIGLSVGGIILIMLLFLLMRAYKSSRISDQPGEGTPFGKI